MAVETEYEVVMSRLHPDDQGLIHQLGKEHMIDVLTRMLLIRNFETRAESAYQHGFIGGFFHSYTGQEAIQTAAVDAIGKDNWWVTTYRCHALALLLGVTPDEAMAELYGRSTGNAKGRGGSMHLYTDRLMGGFGIVGGHVPIATGAAFALKYQNINDQLAVCFMGDGAVAQGAFHESMNLASLWDLPCIYVIENNFWGMGTAVNRAISVEKIAETIAPAYNMQGYTFDGTDYLECYAGFKMLKEQVLSTRRPVLVECIAERFKGHSVSDPGHYRTKERLTEAKLKDPIIRLKAEMEQARMITDELYKKLDEKERDIVIAAMKFAENSPWPEATTLEEDVFAP
jgi:pyruvate dehydrogenase E1 component alpha subunit